MSLGKRNDIFVMFAFDALSRGKSCGPTLIQFYYTYLEYLEYLEQPSSKKSKSTEVPKSDVPADSKQPSVEVPSQKATIN
ncbi:hypothetical protein Tco_0868934, partial [Tanacetum coccineum]